MNIQPWYRSRHIGIGPGLEEGVGGELLAAEWVDSVPELIKKKSDAKDQEHKMVCLPFGFNTAGLTCAFTQSLSLQSFPCSQGSLLNTIPLSCVATGEGWEYRQDGFVHFRLNLQRVGDCGRSGGTYVDLF